MALNGYNEHPLIALAQQGQPKAIAAVLNYYFNERQIWIKVGWEDEHLILLCEALELPSAPEIGPLLAQILGHLNIQRGHQATLYGRIQGEQEPCWDMPLSGVLSHIDSSELLSRQRSNEDHLDEKRCDEEKCDEEKCDEEKCDEEKCDENGPTDQPPPSKIQPSLQFPREPDSPSKSQLALHSPESTNPPPETIEPQADHGLEGDRFLCCILDPASTPQDREANTVLLPVEAIHTIVHIAANAILPVPYMAPCVLGLHQYRGQMLWVVDLWQQLTNQHMGDRPQPWANQFTTLVIQTHHSNELIGFTIPKLAGQVYHCTSPHSPEPSLFEDHLLPFIHQYDPVSHTPILSIDALIQDPRLQMHRA